MAAWGRWLAGIRRTANWLILIYTVTVGGYLLYGPVYGTQASTIVITPEGTAEPVTSRGTAGLAAVEGPSAYVFVAIPMLVAAAPLATRNRRLRRGLNIAAGAAFGALALLAIASVGLLYAPAAFGLGLAAILEPPARAAA